MAGDKVTHNGSGQVEQAQLVAAAKSRLNEDPARARNDVQAVKNWIKQQPHLKHIETGLLMLSVYMVMGHTWYWF
jgi:hypothetical protein